MTRTLIGLDSTGTPCVKITKGSFDPVTTPDSQVSAFYYNSKWSADVKLTQLEATPYAAGTKYTPTGSSQSNYTKVTVVPAGDQMTVVMRNSHFPALAYDLPLFNMKIRRTSTDRWIEVNRVKTQGGDDNLGREPGYWNTLDQAGSAWWTSLNLGNGDSIGTAVGNAGKAIMHVGSIVGSTSVGYEKTVVVWRLPGNNVDIKDSAAKAPVAGQRSIEINSGACRVAKPGYDVRTASPTQLAFDSANRPASIVGGDDISLPAGVTRYELGFSVPNTTVLDLYLYTGGTIAFPMSPAGQALAAEYWFSGTKLFINNLSITCRARFIVIAFDDQPQSSGPNDVLRQISVSGQNVVQFLKPGAASAPRFSDIILDSRWPSLQILSEGFFAVAAQPNKQPPGSVNDGQSRTVTFDATGMFPIVKYMTVHNHPTYGQGVKPPQTSITENYNNQTVYHQGASSYCLLGTNQATFWTFNGNPNRETWNSNDGWSFSYPDAQIAGIRYYILGIPQ